MNPQLIKEQSNAAMKQWAEQWREHCKIHSSFPQKDFDEYENIGVGKAVLCIANGYSLEENISTIQENQRNVDILACDKTLGHLIDHGIVPTYVLVCDANVDYEKYMAPWKDKLSKTVLFINVCANPKWTEGGNWKDIVFFANEDIIKSHLEFSKLSGCKNFIPAATNVSNAMITLLTQSDNGGRNNVFGYDKILLIGFDYSWRHEGNYYAFDKDGGGKSSYMRHSYVVSPSGEFCYTSGNLAFSMDWLKTYVKSFNLPVVQCSKHSILSFGGPIGDLETHMKYRYKPEDREPVRDKVKELKRMKRRENQLINEINKIGQDHYWSYAQSV